jgi:hypothetical protein
VSDSLFSTIGPVPREGDIVVTRTSEPIPRYTIRKIPGEPQILSRTRQQAVQMARRFAQQYRVDVWMAGGLDVQLIASYRTAGDQTRVEESDCRRTQRSS